MGRGRQAKPRDRQRFVVERYAPGVTVASVRSGEDRLRRAAAGAAASGRSVRYLGSLVIAAEETVIAVFEADVAEDVAALHAAAGVVFDRIVPVVELRESERLAASR